MKKYDLCGLGNALVDLLFECSEAEFEKLSMQKGSMRLIDEQQQSVLLKDLGRPVTKSSGGSVANSVALFAQLGGRSSFLCSIAEDDYGQFFKQDMSSIGVDVYSAKQPEHKAELLSGTSVVVVTPDAERSMSTCLAASAQISKDFVNPEVIADSKWLFIEGYLIANSDQARESIFHAIEIAKQNNTKVAITLSDAFVVEGFFDFINQILPQTDLVFCNSTEARAMTAKLKALNSESSESNDGDEENFEYLITKCKGLAMTAGEHGAYINYGGHQGHVAPYACQPVDLTGAGDAFAGGFLHGISSASNNPFEAAKKGCLYASKVIQQWGARLSKPVSL